MSDQKPSTADILAKIRGGGTAPAAKDEPSAPEQPSTPPAAEPEAAPVAETPASTGGILAAIRSGGAPAAPKADAPKQAAPEKPAAATPAPTGTGGILAAIRSGGAGAAPAAAKSPAKKPAKEAPAAAAPTGMSVAEMIRAARGGQDTDAPKAAVPSAEGKAPAAKPALPAKPLVKKPAASAAPVPRRSVLTSLFAGITSSVFVAWAAFSGALAAFGAGLARFMIPNVLAEPPTRFKIGPPTDYSPGTVSTKWKAQFGVWIVNTEVDGKQVVAALSTVCTHLGCTPNWLEGEQKFKCPCHGSGFYINGINFEGPAPRPLERMGIRLAEDGMLEVDKSVKFQRELGQWDNAASYVSV